jgi:Sec-independent protein translocase protein TatA
MDYVVIEGFLRQYWTFIIAAIALVYFGAKKLKDLREDTAASRAAKRVDRAATAEDRAEAIRLARERQQQYVAEQSKKDEEVRKQKQAEALEERMRRAEAAGTKTGGSRVGSAAEEQGPLSKLPRLPGGSRDTYQPTSTGGGGGGYRPSNANICKLKKGG